MCTLGADPVHDFYNRHEVITLSSTSRRQCIVIPIVHDSLYETTETFNVTLAKTSSAPSYVELSPDIATVRIAHVHSMFH